MPFIRDVLDKYFITHNPGQSHNPTVMHLIGGSRVTCLKPREGT